MHIKDIAIDGFGVFHNLAVEDLPPGLTLFEGENEAGKSTLMSFIRAVLFGFESRKSGQNRYDPLQGGRHGGALTLLTGDGVLYRVERYEGGAHGRVKVFDPKGHAYDDALLQKLLHNTSKLLYQNVFAFGLTELQRLETLQAEEVSHHIYTAGMGTGSTPFAQVMSELEDEQGQLFKPGGKKPAINGLLARLDQTQRAIQELQALPEEYYSVTDQIQVAGREILEFQTQLDQMKHRADWLETALRGRSDWEALVAVRGELGELLRLTGFPEGGVERLDQWERALANLDSRRDDTLRTIRELEERRGRLQPDPLLLEHQGTIQALSEDREHFRRLLENLPTLQARVDARRKALDDVLARLGPTWGDDRLAKFDASIPMRERVRTFRDQLGSAKAEWGDAVKRVEEVQRFRREKEAELDRLQRSLENLHALQPATGAPLVEREKALRQWVQHRHRLDLLGQHRRDTKHLRASLADRARAQGSQLAGLEQQRGWPLWLVVLVGLLFMLPAGLAVNFNEWVAGGLVVVGIVLAGLLLWWRDRRQNTRHFKLDEMHSQHQGVVNRIEQLDRETQAMEQDKATIAEQMASLSELAVSQQLHSAEEVEEALGILEAERRVMQRRHDLEARIQEEEEILVRLLEKQQTLEGSVKDKGQAYEEVREAWISLLKTLDVDDTLTPDGALEVLATVEAAKLQLREWQESRQVLDRGEEEARSTTDQINDALGRCGWSPVSSSESTTTLMAIRNVLGETLQAEQELQRLNEQLSDRQGELEACDAERERLLAQQQGLLAAAGATDGDDFRRRAASYKRQVELERQERQLEVALVAHAGSPERCRDLEILLTKTSRAQLERELAETRTEELVRLNDALAAKLQEKGRQEQRLQSLEQNQRLSDTLLDQQTLLAQLEQQTQRWAVRGITRYLLDKARQVYERERQPDVLKQASAFFRTMTRNRYRRVIVPLGETRLEVEGKHGRTKGTESLSRGTAEQLYLSMRLALVREYAKHAGPLPLVVDEILVNFDPVRAQAAIEVLKEISTTHQILFFTCHPHVAAWFRESMPEANIRSLN